MGTQRVNYRQGSDTGERDDANAIQPISDGERVWAAVANRPGENIRGRTESARSVVEDLMYRADTDIKWMIRGGGITGDYMLGGALPAVADWYPEQLGAGNPAVSPSNPYRGEFVIDSPIILEGVLSPGKDMPHVEELYAENAVPPRSYTVYLTSRYQAAAGGDTIRVRWRYEDDTLTPFPSGYLSVYASGDPIHVINIDVAGDGSVTLQQVEAALVADLDIPNLVTITNDGGDTGTVIDTTDIAAPVAGEYVFNSEYQRELHLVSPGVLSAFFGLNPAGSPYLDPNKLKDGDTVGILYPYIKDSEAFFGPHGDDTKVGGRRQATLTNNALPSAPVEVDTSQLFNSSQHPEYVSQAIPLCKRIGDDLIFIDGTVIEGLLDHTAPGYPPGGVKFGEHGHTVNRIVGGSSSILVTLTENWFGGVPLSSGSPATLEAVINAIIEDLASTSLGSALIGSDESLGTSGASALAWNFSANSLYNQLLSAQTSMNARAALGYNEIVTGEWTFDDVTTFGPYRHNIDGSWNKSYPALANYSLFYRFNFDSVPTDEVTWDTTSWYALSGNLLVVKGAVPLAGGINFTAAPDDTGTGQATLLRFQDGSFFVSTRTGLTAGATFQFSDPVRTSVLLDQNVITGRPGMATGGALHLLDDGVIANEGGRITGVSSEEAGGSIRKLFESTSTAGQSGIYMYYADRVIPDAGYDSMGSFLMIARNCHYIGGVSGWAKNVNGQPAQMTVYSPWGVRNYFQAPAVNTWGGPLNPFNGWPDFVESVPSGHPDFGGTGMFNMWPSPLFIRGSVNSASSPLLLNSGVDWSYRRAFVSITASLDPDLINGTPSGDVETAVNAVFACTRHVYFGGLGEARSYNFNPVVLSGSALQILPLSTLTLECNASNDLQMTTASVASIYFYGTIIPTLKYV